MEQLKEAELELLWKMHREGNINHRCLPLFQREIARSFVDRGWLTAQHLPDPDMACLDPIFYSLTREGYEVYSERLQPAH